MVPKSSSKSKATSFNGTLKFWVSKKKIGKIWTFSKKQRAQRVKKKFQLKKHHEDSVYDKSVCVEIEWIF